MQPDKEVNSHAFVGQKMSLNLTPLHESQSLQRASPTALGVSDLMIIFCRHWGVMPPLIAITDLPIPKTLCYFLPEVCRSRINALKNWKVDFSGVSTSKRKLPEAGWESFSKLTMSK